jgi:hypothetical protein
MYNLSVDVYGLNEIQEYINPKRINKELAIGVGIAVLQLHNTLKTEIFQRYNVPNNITTALVGGISPPTLGRNSILSGLNYKDTPQDLSRFPYTPAYQNRKKRGQVFETTVVRGQTKVVHGKYGYGGFVAPRRGETKGGPTYSLFMYERKQKATWLSKGVRAPFRIIQTLTLVDMVNIALIYNPKVKVELNKLEQTIINNFIL